MSTSVINPGTTRSAGPSGRFVGLAAAALAAVIALGFVFAANQGNEATESVTESRVSQVEKDAWDSRVDFLTQQYHMRQASQPTVNIEKYRLETAGLIGAITPSTSPEAYKVLQQQAGKAQVNPRVFVTVPEPVFSPELARLQALNTARLQAMWSQRYQDLIDRFESLTVPNGHETFSPEAARISVPAQSLESFRLDMIDQVPTHANWPQGFEDLMDTYNARIAAAKVADEAPRVPREKRS